MSSTQAAQEQSTAIPRMVIGAVVATGIMSFCGVIVETAMNITFPALMSHFSIGTSSVQWMTTLYLLVVASITPLSAALKRRFRSRTLFLCANLLFLTGLVIDALAPIFPLLLLGRAIQGLGTSIALPLMFNIILQEIPIKRIGTMMGVGTLITAIGPAVGPTFGGLVATTIGWRFVFIILIPVLVISLVTGLACIPSVPVSADRQAAGLGPLDVFLMVLGFVGLIFGISNASAGWLSWRFGGTLALGLVTLTAFSLRAQHQAYPIIDVYLFTDSCFSLHVGAYILFEICALALSFILPNHLQLVDGCTSLQAGLVLLPGAAIGAVLAPLSGRLYDQLGPRIPIISGSCVAFVGLLGFALTARRLTAITVLVLYIFFMLGIGLSFGNIMTNGLHRLSSEQQADGNAIFNTVQQFAAAIGSSLAATIVAAGQAAVADRRLGTINGSQHALILLLIVGTLEVLLILAAPRRSQKPQHA
ncbi:MFS transporter [Bifidobacterium sp. B4142]|uniref:MFS transporter n=1 Tax=Bifidobacterium sp. B4142 TaxID=2817962 RepID=UPI00226B30BD|nr:MFS transporter [Bifidobacterium sp. B4142]MCX8688221.1 MFS transporter [Bifidobacterium sp. B4142]